jgi:ABC-type hemin transport system ATPase subunit
VLSRVIHAYKMYQRIATRTGSVYIGELLQIEVGNSSGTRQYRTAQTEFAESRPLALMPVSGQQITVSFAFSANTVIHSDRRSSNTSTKFQKNMISRTKMWKCQ